MSSVSIAFALDHAHRTADRLFPFARPVVKLQEEARELQAALAAGKEGAILEEVADCLICLAHVLDVDRMQQIADMIVHKCGRLERRTWVFDEDTQTYHHVKEAK